MYCQLIEHNIKLIYAGMLDGEFDENFEEIERWTLGQNINKLEKLDNSDNKPEFSKSDYELLKEITANRNH